ncbi:MAG: hypothetical protein K2W96_00095, partial [Gemmataceae bacterium]|nr:hypothetical protein [Gemmataceae bacterium]
MAAIRDNRLAPSILAWIPLMIGGQAAGAVATWREVIEATEPDELKRRERASLAVIFADLTECRDVWETGLEGFAVTESSVMARERGVGEHRGLRNALLRVLRGRFKEGLPNGLVARIEAEKSDEKLGEWLDTPAPTAWRTSSRRSGCERFPASKP